MKGPLTEIQKREESHRLVMTLKFPLHPKTEHRRCPRLIQTQARLDHHGCAHHPWPRQFANPGHASGFREACQSPTRRCWRNTSDSTDSTRSGRGLSPLCLACIAPHSTPTTAAAIILANFALAMWTVGWFLLYFVALSNIS